MFTLHEYNRALTRCIMPCQMLLFLPLLRCCRHLNFHIQFDNVFLFHTSGNVIHNYNRSVSISILNYVFLIQLQKRYSNHTYMNYSCWNDLISIVFYLCVFSNKKKREEEKEAHTSVVYNHQLTRKIALVFTYEAKTIGKLMHKPHDDEKSSTETKNNTT